MAFPSAAERCFLIGEADNSSLAFPSAAERCFFILHSNCCIALCEPAATELKSKKRSRISLMQRSLYTDSFFCLIYLLIFIWFGLYLNRTNGISDGFCCEKNTANIFLLNTNRTCKCAAPALSRVRYWIISISAAASGNACKSV